MISKLCLYCIVVQKSLYFSKTKSVNSVNRLLFS